MNVSNGLMQFAELVTLLKVTGSEFTLMQDDYINNHWCITHRDTLRTVELIITFANCEVHWVDGRDQLESTYVYDPKATTERIISYLQGGSCCMHAISDVGKGA